MLLKLHFMLARLLGFKLGNSSASKNTDSSVFYTEIETKVLNTDSDSKILIEIVKSRMQTCRTLQK